MSRFRERYERALRNASDPDIVLDGKLWAAKVSGLVFGVFYWGLAALFAWLAWRNKDSLAYDLGGLLFTVLFLYLGWKPLKFWWGARKYGPKFFNKKKKKVRE